MNRAIEILITVAHAAHTAADNTEDAGDADFVKMDRAGFDALSVVLDKLDELPDDRPGHTMSGPGRAEWALRPLHIGASRFEGWYSEQPFGGDGGHLPTSGRHIKQDMRDAYAAGLAESSQDVADAEKWRALIGCARVRPLGNAGCDIESPNDYYGEPYGDYAHVGFEFWTKYKLTPQQQVDAEEARALGVKWLNVFVEKAQRIAGSAA